MGVTQKKPMVKLKDVASDAEVSIATVSLALRNHPSIPGATRRRILEAQERLGYVPIRKRTPSIRDHSPNRDAPQIKSILYCVVNFPIRKIQYADFLEGVMQACEQRDIRLEVKSISKSDNLAAYNSEDFRMDGNILTGELDRAMVERFLEINPRTIVLGNYRFPHVHSVELDVFGMGETVADQLVKDGHQRVAHLLRDPKSYYERQFLMGLLDGLSIHGIHPPQQLQVDNLFESVSATVGAIRKMRTPVTAVTSAVPNVSQACLNEMRVHQADNTVPLPIFYTTNMISEEHSTPSLRIIDAGLQRCGILAVERLSQIHASTSSFPFAAIVPAAGWREM